MITKPSHNYCMLQQCRVSRVAFEDNWHRALWLNYLWGNPFLQFNYFEVSIVAAEDFQKCSGQPCFWDDKMKYTLHPQIGNSHLSCVPKRTVLLWGNLVNACLIKEPKLLEIKDATQSVMFKHNYSGCWALHQKNTEESQSPQGGYRSCTFWNDNVRIAVEM